MNAIPTAADRLTCTSTHCERRQECSTPSECTGSAKGSGPFAKQYRGWSINFDHPPIPMRGNDWSATSPDYEVDCDEDGFHVVGGQQVHSDTYEGLIAEIDEAIAESAA